METGIIELLVEPDQIYVNKTFKLKIKVKDISKEKKYISTESSKNIVSEDNKILIAEWGE